RRLPPSRATVQWLGLIAGPAVALLLYLLLPAAAVDPTTGESVPIGDAGRATMAVLGWMAVWWLTEAIDVAATALLPVALFPLLGARTAREATAPYGSDVIFLFLGSFVLALALQRWGLDRRIALFTLRLVGTRPDRMVGGLMLATAGMSAFVSNTATVAMMLPIALSLIEVAAGAHEGAEGAQGAHRQLTVCALLGIAYAASVGGLATLVGTPPNLFFAGFAREAWGREVTFLGWLGVGLPAAAIFLPVVWLLLTRGLFPLRDLEVALAPQELARRYRQLGPANRGEVATFAVFLATAGAWIFRPLLVALEIAGRRPLAGLTDAGIAMLAALALFVIPVDRAERTFVMDWETARRLPWGVLVLFGGGLSLAAAVEGNGVDRLIGLQAGRLAELPPLLVVATVTAAVVFLTELTSNTATAATLLPILAAAAPRLGIEPVLLVVPATLAASCAFMLPVATPPNAIVFGSGRVEIPDMVRAGLWLNLVGIALITLLAFTAVPWVFGG
ncbi:MAG TPA: SLC13 family permease, partial [Thermoanaerobaculia bacterium]|nr:SLC13 family permease [Thermoanaerobaculia bacterium]